MGAAFFVLRLRWDTRWCRYRTCIHELVFLSQAIKRAVPLYACLRGVLWVASGEMNTFPLSKADPVWSNRCQGELNPIVWPCCVDLTRCSEFSCSVLIEASFGTDNIVWSQCVSHLLFSTETTFNCRNVRLVRAGSELHTRRGTEHLCKCISMHALRWIVSVPLVTPIWHSFDLSELYFLAAIALSCHSSELILQAWVLHTLKLLPTQIEQNDANPTSEKKVTTSACLISILSVCMAIIRVLFYCTVDSPCNKYHENRHAHPKENLPIYSRENPLVDEGFFQSLCIIVFVPLIV